MRTLGTDIDDPRLSKRPADRVVGASRTTGGTFFRSRPSRGGGGFTGKAKVRGIQNTNLRSDPSKPYVHCIHERGLAEQHAGPEPIPWAPGESWWLKREAPRVIVVW